VFSNLMGDVLEARGIFTENDVLKVAYLDI
jgi:hypothetical protein